MNFDSAVFLRFIKPRLERLAEHGVTDIDDENEQEIVQLLAQYVLEQMNRPATSQPASHPTQSSPVDPTTPSATPRARKTPQRKLEAKNRQALERARRRREDGGMFPEDPFSGDPDTYADEDVEPPMSSSRTPRPPLEANPQEKIQFDEEGKPIVDPTKLTVPPPDAPPTS